jgi:hypothetical protein
MDNLNNSSFSADTVVQPRCPKGVLILGWISFLVFGVLAGIMFSTVYFFITPGNWAGFLEEIKRIVGQDTKLSLEYLKAALLAQLMLAAVFAVIGLGLIRKKEWARRTAIYLSFFLAAIQFIGVLFNPGMIGQTILNIIFPGSLIIYFTNKNVEKYFYSLRK